MGLLPQAHHEAAAPSSDVHPPLQAWQGEASRCREADGQLLGAEGDHAGHESGRLRRPCCSKRTSGARVLSATGFEELRRYDDVRVPEPSHQARHDLPRRQGLEHRQLVSRHRQLLMTDFVINESTVTGVQPRGPPEAATALFRSLRASLRQAKDLDLLRRQRRGENSPGKLPGSHGSPRRGSGRVRHGVQPGHAAIERNLLRDERPLKSSARSLSASILKKNSFVAPKRSLRWACQASTSSSRAWTQHAGEVRVVESNHLRAVAPPRGPRQILPLRSCEVVRGEAQPQVPVHVRALVLLGLLLELRHVGLWQSPSSPGCRTSP